MTRRRKVLMGALVVAVALVAVQLLRPKPASNAVSSQPASLTVAPAPPPTSLPVIGATGRDASGLPLQRVDQPGFRSLLLHHRYKDLDTYFEQLQTDFETDFRNEDLILDAADAFDSAEPELEPLLNAWAGAADSSYAGLLARGTWAVSMAWAARGEGWWKDVSPDAQEKTAQWLAQATKDLERAIALRPTLMAARRELIRAASTGGDAALRDKTYDRAIEECPNCYRVRVVEIYALRPRWGGTYEQMAALAQAAPVGANPRLKLLAGYALLDQAELLLSAKKFVEARKKIEEALANGDSPDFLEVRGKVSWWEEKYDDALRDFDRALELRPSNRQVRVDRIRLQLTRHGYEEAGRDLLFLLRVDPNNPEAKRLWPDVVQGLTYTLDQLYKARRVSDAERVVELAQELASDQKSVRQWGMWVADLAVGDAGVDELTANAVAAPHDFRSHRLLDHWLFKQRRAGDVVAMWTQFLKDNPNHGRALVERSGAQWLSGHPAEAIADAKAACDLGTNAGCAVAAELTRRLTGQ